MKKVLLVVLVMMNVSALRAQIPNVEMWADTISTSTGAKINLPFRVAEFWNVTNVEGSITWDPAVIQFDTVSSFVLPYYDSNTFDLTNSANGVISFEWAHFITVGSTLNDGDIIFTLSFDVIGADGDSTLIELGDVPVPLYWYNFAGWSGTIDHAPGLVAVSCAPSPVAGFTYNGTGLSYSFTDTSSNATSLLWDFGDGTTDTVPSPAHNFATSDTFTVCLYASNACGTDSVCQEIITSNPTGIDDSGAINLSVFPNPFVSELNVELPGDNASDCVLRIYDLYGRLLSAHSFGPVNGRLRLYPDLPQGVYLLEVETEDLYYTTRIVSGKL
jgi:PKD repeat protein